MAVVAHPAAGCLALTVWRRPSAIGPAAAVGRLAPAISPPPKDLKNWGDQASDQTDLLDSNTQRNGSPAGQDALPPHAIPKGAVPRVAPPQNAAQLAPHTAAAGRVAPVGQGNIRGVAQIGGHRPALPARPAPAPRYAALLPPGPPAAPPL